MRVSRDNRGTSLVELVIAMAIAAVVISMIMFFINVAAKSFRKTSEEVNLQMEAQTTVNQISNLAMEAKAMEVLAAAGESRYIFHYNNNEFCTIIFTDGEKKLYQVSTTDLEQAKTATYNMQQNFLAEYVQSLEISVNSTNQSVTIDLKLALGKDEYQIKKTVKMRNAK